MKKITMVICAFMLVATALFAGCAQDAPPDDSGAAATVQFTQTPAESTPVPAEITASPAPAPVPAGSSDPDAAAADEDSQLDQYNSTGHATTMAPDSADLGSPVP